MRRRSGRRRRDPRREPLTTPVSLPPPAGLRRILLLVAIWLAGTVLATATVYEAVTVVAGQVTAQRSAGLSPSDLDQASRRLSPSPSSLTPASPTPTSDRSPSPAPPSTAPVPAAPATSSPGATPPPPARTFGLVGGTAEVSCRGNVASLDWATPNSGFSVETGSSDSGTQVEVRFRSDAHESRLEAWCSGGQVQGSVREEAT